MKKPDEIKKALECCFNAAQCGDCPYYPTSCDRELVRDAREYIRQLEERCKNMNDLRDAAAGRALKMEERVHQLETERDAAVADLQSYAALECFACKYYEVELTEVPCNECKIMGKGNRDMFEWRGVQKEG